MTIQIETNNNDQVPFLFKSTRPNVITKINANINMEYNSSFNECLQLTNISVCVHVCGCVWVWGGTNLASVYKYFSKKYHYLGQLEIHVYFVIIYTF